MDSIALRLALFALCAVGCGSGPASTEEYHPPIKARIRVDAPRIHEFLCGGTLDVSTDGEFVHHRTDNAPSSCRLSMRTDERTCTLVPAHNGTLSLYFRHRISRPFTIDSCRDLALLVEVWPHEITSNRYILSPTSVEPDGNGCVYRLYDP